MPKRKRETDVSTGDRVSQKRKQNVYETYTQYKKLLHRAFKIAKGFERQKLAKRLKLALSRSNVADIARIRREIDTVKSLDLAKVTAAHLHRNLLKRRPFVDSQLLPDEVNILPRPEGTEEMAVALHNVTSGMCNTKDVRETVERTIIAMYMSMGIPVPHKNAPEMKAKRSRGVTDEEGANEPIRSILPSTDEPDMSGNTGGDDELSWESNASMNEGVNQGEHTPGDEFEIEGEDGSDFAPFDSGDLSDYEARLGSSSEGESSEDEENTRVISARLPEGLGVRGRRPDPNRDQVSGPEVLLPRAPVVSTTTKSTSTTSRKLEGSTFLPSLMGGYYSGSESASDIEDSTPAPRKNRPGQMARRAIWEKKYGARANHVKSGKRSIAEPREADSGWDPKRGAKDDGHRGKMRDQRNGRSRNQAGYGGALRNKATVVEPEKKSSGRADDLGILHPSWQAAKKAKDMTKTAQFAGKKVTFD